MSEKDIIDITENLSEEKAPDFMSVNVKNPRIGKIQALEEEAKKRYETELTRRKQIRLEQDYVDKMIESVERNMLDSREEQRLNQEFEHKIHTEIYRMHGISEDKLEGMEERNNAIFQGIAMAMFLISVLLIVICGLIHGFDCNLCIFMAFYTAIEGTLLSKGKKKNKIVDVTIKGLFIILLPVMIVAFVFYEVRSEWFELIIPYCVIAGIIVLVIGAISYFIYDPYRNSKKDKRKAEIYIKEMEKVVKKDLILREKEVIKQEKNLEKKRAKEEKRNEKVHKRQAFKEKLIKPFKKNKEDVSDGRKSNSNVQDDNIAVSDKEKNNSNEAEKKDNAETINSSYKSEMQNKKDSIVAEGENSESALNESPEKKQEDIKEPERPLSGIDAIKKMQKSS